MQRREYFGNLKNAKWQYKQNHRMACLYSANRWRNCISNYFEKLPEKENNARIAGWLNIKIIWWVTKGKHAWDQQQSKSIFLIGSVETNVKKKRIKRMTGYILRHKSPPMKERKVFLQKSWRSSHIRPEYLFIEELKVFP